MYSLQIGCQIYNAPFFVLCLITICLFNFFLQNKLDRADYKEYRFQEKIIGFVKTELL